MHGGGGPEAAAAEEVDALADSPKVFGYYLADEPHPIECPTAVEELRARADYIHARAPGQVAFIVVIDGTNTCGGTLGCEYRALRPDETHVDLIGVDIYPCHYAPDGSAEPCDNGAITTRVNAAVASGISIAQIVPVFQTFGQQGRTDGSRVYYRMPTADELESMYATWRELVPSPIFDVAYTYGTQCTESSCVAPQAIENHPMLHPVVREHNR